METRNVGKVEPSESRQPKICVPIASRGESHSEGIVVHLAMLLRPYGT